MMSEENRAKLMAKVSILQKELEECRRLKPPSYVAEFVRARPAPAPVVENHPPLRFVWTNTICQALGIEPTKEPDSWGGAKQW